MVEESAVVLLGKGNEEYVICRDDDVFGTSGDLLEEEHVWWNFDRGSEGRLEAKMETGKCEMQHVDLASEEGDKGLGCQDEYVSIAKQKDVAIKENRVSLVSVISSEIHIDDDIEDDETVSDVTGDLRLPWMWVEGWRARLRMSGDVVEKSRWEWRMDDAPGMRVVNTVPIVVATTPVLGGVLAVGGGLDIEGLVGEARRKSVRWG